MEISRAQGTENSWESVATYVTMYSWGQEEQQIYYISTDDENKNGNMTELAIDIERFYMTLDGGMTSEFVSEEGVFAFSTLDGIVYAAKYDEETSRSDLYIMNSTDSFTPAQFHGENSIQHVSSSLFLILDNSEDVSFLTVCNTNYSLSSNLFQANVVDGLYWLNRPNLRATCDTRYFRGADFQRIKSLDATYISNGYPNEDVEDGENMENYIQSAITFNKGGSWSLLTPPVDSVCQKPNCSLHLFSYVDSESIYSKDNAVGIILATGNEGEYRAPLSDPNTALYLSRNGGFTWDKLKTGHYFYSTSNHASLIVLIPKALTNEFHYTWDQGSSWSTCLFTDDPVEVDYIINPNEDNSDFVIVGKMIGGASGFVATVAVSDTTIGICDGFAVAGTPNSDYEYFEQKVGDSCILGEDITYTRRKKDVSCVSNSSERKNSGGSCVCTRLDFTCDGDCWRASINETNGDITCINDCLGLPNDPQAPPSNCTGTYSPPSGYRLVFGDSCIGGLQLQNDLPPVPCPTAESSTSSLSPTPTNSPTQTSSNSPTPTSTLSPGSSPSDTPTISSPMELTNSTTPTPSTSYSPAVSPVPPINQDTPTEQTDSGVSVGMIIGGLFLAFMILLILLVLLAILLYKFNPK